MPSARSVRVASKNRARTDAAAASSSWANVAGSNAHGTPRPSRESDSPAPTTGIEERNGSAIRPATGPVSSISMFIPAQRLAGRVLEDEPSEGRDAVVRERVVHRAVEHDGR